MSTQKRKAPWNRGPWGYIQPWDTKMFGESIADPKEQARWGRVIRTGGLPYIWREMAAPMVSIIYSLMEVKPGDKVLIIGESVEPCGWAEDIRDMVGKEGEVRCVEILEQARQANSELRKGRGGMVGTWQWDYTKDTPDNHYDCVAALQSVQHCDDWRETGADLLRVLKPGKRLVLAELAMFGRPFWPRVETDLHMQYWVEKISAHRPHDIKETSYYSPEQLHAAFDGLMDDAQNIEWKGIELFWGRKPKS